MNTQNTIDQASTAATSPLPAQPYPDINSWESAIATRSTISSLQENGEICEAQTKIMTKILAMREEYNLESGEFSAILKYIVERGNYMSNFTQIEDIYFEFAIRLLKKQEVDAWLGHKMYSELNPMKNPVVGEILVKVVGAMRDSTLKGDDMFAFAHMSIYPNMTSFKHSSCAIILNTINNVRETITSNPPGSE